MDASLEAGQRSEVRGPIFYENPGVRVHSESGPQTSVDRQQPWGRRVGASPWEIHALRLGARPIGVKRGRVRAGSLGPCSCCAGEILESDLRSGPPRFDSSAKVWVLSRYADVVAALSHDGIVVPGGSDPVGSTASGVRTSRQIEHFGDLLLGGSGDAAQARPVDLLAEVAAPWGLALAVSVTGASTEDVERLQGCSHRVFLGAANAGGFGVSASAAEATVALATMLGGPSAPWHAQAFVALAETLPRLLAGIWFVLVEHVEVARVWRGEPQARTRILDELLRVASPSRFVFRAAACPLEIGGASIAEGDAIHLALGAANHDPAVFPTPDRPRRDRKGPPHVAFGRAPHGCPGAGLVRRAAAHATESLLSATTGISLAAPVTWAGRAIRGPTALPVHLTWAEGCRPGVNGGDRVR